MDIFVGAIAPFAGLVGCGMVMWGAGEQKIRIIKVGVGLIAIPLVAMVCIIARYYL